MQYIFREPTMRRAAIKAKKYISENKENILKTDMRCPIVVTMKNGNEFLFMSYAVFDNWHLGRRDYEII